MVQASAAKDKRTPGNPAVEVRVTFTFGLCLASPTLDTVGGMHSTRTQPLRAACVNEHCLNARRLQNY